MRKLSVIFLLLAGMALFVGAMTPEALKSYRNFEKKAEKGDREAQYRLALILESGYDTIVPDTARAVRLLLSSADQGFAPSQNYLGYLYQKGQGVKQNLDSAAYWLRMAADAGDPKASANLAYLMLNRADDAHNSTTDSIAAAYLKVGAEAGLPTAITQLAGLYETGRGVECDTVRAVNLYDEAIRLGWHDAELRLLNFMGPVWKQMAKEKPSEALQEGAYYYRLGAPTTAVEILSGILPDHPIDPDAVPETLLNVYADAFAILGEAYSTGNGAEYDNARGISCYAVASRLGNPGAQFVLAELLDLFPDAAGEIDLNAYELRRAAAASGITDATSAAFLIHNPGQ